MNFVNFLQVASSGILLWVIVFGVEYFLKRSRGYILHFKLHHFLLLRFLQYRFHVIFVTIFFNLIFYYYDKDIVQNVLALSYSYTFSKIYPMPKILTCEDYKNNFGNTPWDELIRSIHESAQTYPEKNILFPFCGTLISSLRWGRSFNIWNVKEDLDFAISFPNMSKKEANQHFRIFIDHVVESNWRLEVGTMSNQIYSPIFHHSFFPNVFSRLIGYCNKIDFHLIFKDGSSEFLYTPIPNFQNFENEKKCLLSGIEFHCSSNAIMLLMNHNHEYYDAPCLGFPLKDHYCAMEAILAETKQLYECGYQSFWPIFNSSLWQDDVEKFGIPDQYFQNIVIEDCAKKVQSKTCV